MFSWLRGKKRTESPDDSRIKALPSSHLSAQPEEKKKSPAHCPLGAAVRDVMKDLESSRFFLGVWNCNTAISDGEAARLYASLSEGLNTTAGFSDELYAFYSHLIRRYPEIDLVPENELENCPWASAIDMSDTYVIMAIQPNKSAQVLPVVMALAKQHGLTCFDPQAGKVYLPPRFGSQAQAADA
jgi:hypothetical protein